VESERLDCGVMRRE